MKIVCRDVTYSVEIAGNGEPLVLLHGFTGNRDTWKFLIPLLCERYTLIMVDIIGHGGTASPADYRRYEMKQVTDDLKHILDELNFPKTHILGYSMGGRLALGFACLYPEYVKTLMLESASPGLLTEEEREIRRSNDKKLAGKILENGIEAFVDQWENIPLFESQKRLSSKTQAAIRQQRLENNPSGLSSSLLGMGTGSQASYWEELEFLDFPVLLVTGELDPKFCLIAESMQKMLKQAEWKIINDAGHAIHVEDGEKFGKIISEFLMRN
ncbi:2-succinyl-6-hydroxy-2,4-cyclohexadiene-1-carboxylate synthase [Peribacillus sp. TH24]|uniref:2-succinyl-6-hydroxy-2, 4-cyclohexadiene-1-carboxylate synthase n=1 Tax=Peribacillus sp. TH24 TaxID=2798483 RepID=UPI0019138DDA|nr:2-succinyl-6-hydroxy-2,4-cyclohexadiene-1-carboxylate synthase [Peribacillus sp. TH24]MBK5443653.1 2-succinyl-6-hydroxy-2,4-cyclohexadiene-1-carboxylate synthase [Peribacillus sp. TH24]